MRSLPFLLALAVSSATAAPTDSSTSSSSTTSKSHTIEDATYRSATLTAEGFTSEAWRKGFEKAREVMKQMSLQEKIDFTDLGDSQQDFGGCAGVMAPVERFGIPERCFADGPTGIHTRYTTQYPTELTSAATWDVELLARRADELGKEYHQLGVHVPLSIIAGGMGRTPYGGRNWENWFPDPYLTGVATRLTVEGFQKNGVVGLLKHYYGNEQEYLRTGIPQSGYTGNTENQTVDAHIDAATERELYVWPFAEAIRSGAGGVMCGYNLLHSSLVCQNSPALNGLLKQELSLPGFTLTDWYAAWETAKTALGGSDFVEANKLYGVALDDLIKNGTLPDDIIDDKVVRILTPYYALNQKDLPARDLTRYVVSESSSKIVRDIATHSLTLLKNVRLKDNKRGLPLLQPRDLLLVGSPAGNGPMGLLHNGATTFYYHTLREWPGFITSGFGSGDSYQPYAIDPFTAVSARGRKSERPVVTDGYFWDDPTAGQSFVPYSNETQNFLDFKLAYANTAVVFVSAPASEAYDRANLSLALGGDNLIQFVAERHNDTVVVITAPGPVDMSAWIDHDNVTAVIYAYFPTIEGGNAIASVLFGDVSPSGKLPFTLAEKVEDYNDARYTGPVTQDNPVANFTEGPFIDYRYFDAQNITPKYEFGFGLSYSTFSLSDLRIAKNPEKRTALVRETNEVFIGDDKTGLYDRAYTVKAVVKNTGSVAAAEVAQLYISFPSSTPRKLPIRQLRGFTKPFLKPGESKTVEFELRNKDMAYYDVVQGGWVVPKGEFIVSVGNSSRKLPLTGTIKRETL